MEKKEEYLQKIDELLKHGTDIYEILPEINELKKQFEEEIANEQKKQLEDFVSDGGEADNFVAEKTEEQARFNDLIYIANERKVKKDQEVKEQYKLNLESKKKVIASLNELIEKEENIGTLFNRMNELREEWKGIGNVSSHDYKAVQNEYSTVLEKFFYNINIYKELQSHDLKRNLQLREELVEKTRLLLEEKSINTVRSQIGLYLGEWDNIGPVTKEEWTKVRDEFRANTKQVYDKIKAHYSAIKEQRQTNLLAKKELLAEIKQILETDIETFKSWKNQTNKVLDIQAKWKKIGFATKDDNDAIWQEFRSLCNEFFDRKKERFSEEKKKWGENKERKQKLIERANELKDLTEWKDTTDKMIRLQNDWKRIGPASQKDEQKLWLQFRGACDHFFNAKKEYYDTLDDRLAENLKKKEAFISKLEKTKLGSDKEANSQLIKETIKQWRDLGMVPKKDMKRINDQYQKVIDNLYNQLGLDKKATGDQKFADKIEELRQSEKAERLLKNEQQFIREQIDKLKKEILQYENNLSFFGFSKGDAADKMKQEVQQKIDKVQQKVDDSVKKLKVVSSALKSLEVKA